MPDNATDRAEASPDVSPAVAVGRRLSAAREAAGISVAEVTAKIHLSATVIAALEAGDFAAVGAPVFVRGHLRSYARLLNLPEAEVTAACPDTPMTADTLLSGTSRPDFGPGFSIVSAALLGCLLLVALVALIYWAAGDDPEDQSEPAAELSLVPSSDAGTDSVRLVNGRFRPAEMVPSHGLSGNNTGHFVISSSTLVQA